SLDQRRDRQIIWTDAIERRQSAAEHVVHAAKLPRPLDRADVRYLLHDADDRAVAPRVATDRAQLVLGEIEAAGARAHALAEGDECLGQALRLLGGLAKEMIGQAKRRLPTDAGETGQLGRQIVDRRHRTDSALTRRAA